MPDPKSIYFAALLTITPLIWTGCTPPDSAASKTRKPSQSPNFYADQENPTGAMSDKFVDDIDVSFLKADHFGCFLINVAQLVKQPLLAELPWSQINEALSPLIGRDNAEVSNIERVWVVLDSEFIQFPSGLSPAPGKSEATRTAPWVVILDVTKPIDRPQLQAANERRAPSETEQAGENEGGTTLPQMESVALTDNRLAIGDAAALAKLTGEQRIGTELVAELRRLPKDADVLGAITTRPLRPILRSVFDLLAGFSPEAKKYADLPTDLKKLTLAINLNSPDDFFELAVSLDNPELRAEIVKLGNAAISSGLSATSGGRPGLPLGDLISANSGQKPMLIQSTPQALEKVVAEIQKSQMPRLKTVDDAMVIQMGRPASLPILLSAVIQDAQQEIELSQRIQNMEKIGDALEQYERKYGVLPSVQAHAPTTNLPGQLSWRVAILPMLGYQKLYDRFDFDLPWNHENNLAVAVDIPAEYRSAHPSDPPHSTPHANIHLYAGDGGLHADQKASPKLEAIKDRKIWTAIAIEGPAQSWTEPNAVTDSNEPSAFGNESEQGVLMIDGNFNVRAVVRDPKNIQAVLSTDGQESLKRTDFIRLKK